MIPKLPVIKIASGDNCYGPAIRKQYLRAPAMEAQADHNPYSKCLASGERSKYRDDFQSLRRILPFAFHYDQGKLHMPRCPTIKCASLDSQRINPQPTVSNSLLDGNIDLWISIKELS
jgi:hypothetical protein